MMPRAFRRCALGRLLDMDERDAGAQYGPNTRLVGRFLDRLGRAPTLHWLDAVTRWSDTDESSGAMALRGLSVALDRSDMHDVAARVASRVQECARSVTWSGHAVDPVVERELIERASSVATQAAWALVLRGMLDEWYVGILYAPWSQYVPLFALERDG